MKSDMCSYQEVCKHFRGDEPESDVCGITKLCKIFLTQGDDAPSGEVKTKRKYTKRGRPPKVPASEATQ